MSTSLHSWQRGNEVFRGKATDVCMAHTRNGAAHFPYCNTIVGRGIWSEQCWHHSDVIVCAWALSWKQLTLCCPADWLIMMTQTSSLTVTRLSLTDSRGSLKSVCVCAGVCAGVCASVCASVCARVCARVCVRVWKSKSIREGMWMSRSKLATHIIIRNNLALYSCLFRSVTYIFNTFTLESEALKQRPLFRAIYTKSALTSRGESAHQINLGRR